MKKKNEKDFFLTLPIGFCIICICTKILLLDFLLLGGRSRVFSQPIFSGFENYWTVKITTKNCTNLFQLYCI